MRELCGAHETHLQSALVHSTAIMPAIRALQKVGRGGRWQGWGGEGGRGGMGEGAVWGAWAHLQSALVHSAIMPAIHTFATFALGCKLHTL